jgi:nucleoside-diphosphate-sugar epimerase
MAMKIMITGAAGFLGQRLARALLTSSNAPAFNELVLVDVVPPTRPNDDLRVRCQVADLTVPGTVEALLEMQPDIVFHLAGVMSGQAEADFELGIKVNFDVTRHLLEAIRRNNRVIKFIFTSSLAVFGGELPSVVTDMTAVNPQSSYGAQKGMCELLINDYTRKGFIDGRILRLPTVSVRPGAPNQAASSFASSIIREPLQGKHAICPVNPDLSIWLASPDTVIYNLLHAAMLPVTAFGSTRTVNLPGITVTVREMIDALTDIAGADTAALIRFEHNEAINRFIASLPGNFNTQRALAMGFRADHQVHDLIHQFINNDLQEARSNTRN